MLDQNVEVLTIIDSKAPLTISPIFIPFTKLQVLQINDANVQSIGMHSFWGVQSLRVLGTYITFIYDIYYFYIWIVVINR